MTYSRIDWVVMWKLFHVQFFWIYLALGVPIRFVAARRFRAASTCKTTLSIVVASFASSNLYHLASICSDLSCWATVGPFVKNSCRRVSSILSAPRLLLIADRNH